MSQAKERPILFGGPMVRALLDGHKTVTRRPVKHQPFDLSWSRRDHSFNYVSGRAANGDEVDGFWAYTTRSGGQWEAKCPYGQPGDRLWVRETWLEDPEDDGSWGYTQYMGCKGSPLSDIPKRFQKPGHCLYRACWAGSALTWRPSIHMPRWASRILLEITDVHVERLQDISEKQALAEGVMSAERDIDPDGNDYSPLELFGGLWVKLNGMDSWSANPWVWVVEFKRVQP